MSENGRRQRKKDATSTAIVTAAMRLFEAEGFDAVTMERIAEAADIAKATLYRYFPVKEAILGAFLRTQSEDWQPRTEEMIRTVPGTRARLTFLYEGSARWFEQHRVYMERYISWRLSPQGRSEERSGFHSHVEAVIAAGQREGDVRTDMPAEMLATSLAFLHLGATMVWLRDGCSLVESVRPMISVFLDGAAPRE
jgi:AcrR family transcriptional regulator